MFRNILSRRITTPLVLAVVISCLLICASAFSKVQATQTGQSPQQPSPPSKPATAGDQDKAGQKPDKQEPKPAGEQSPDKSKPTEGGGETTIQVKKPSKDEGQIPPINTEIVTLTVTVTDPYNRLVTGLDKDHFEIFEDKVKQNIQFFNDDDSPVSLGIIFDVSGSMKGKLDRAREALKAFVDTSHQDDDFFLVGFNQRANLLAEFTDGNSLVNKLTLVDPRGQTALYDAAYLGIEKVKQGRHQKRAVLLITDGQDNSSRYTYGELRKMLKEANVQIYSLGIVEMGGGAGGTLDMQGQSILEEISQVTGGKAFFPRSAAELEDAVTRIALELRHQYSIGYYPNNNDRNGQWRKIKVGVKPPRGLPHLTVRAKEGYYAVK
ncbi:MAG TPA: VWA domain-containing protein [Blastocatellia bacterium]|nr:VWA domain-containing protein [Blastocatellia bacterium]